jgi:2,3-bisphosphoglycerate-independent phosphoglycerate mutase
MPKAFPHNSSQGILRPFRNGKTASRIMNCGPLLFLFLDGVGLGPSDPTVNPFCAANLPNLSRLLEGRRLDSALPPFHGSLASFRPIDATLGVEGPPQSATGQAALLTGVNVSGIIGEHYGPKPDARIRPILEKENLLARLAGAGRTARLLNAYPDSYFAAVRSGRRLHAAIALAFSLAGIPLPTADDLDRGEALSADFTGRGWRTRLRRPRTPTLPPDAAGRRMAQLASACDFSVFDHWLTDYAGHFGEMRGAVRLLEVLDAALGGIAAAAQDSRLSVIVSSDHGNMEDLSVKGHTRNPVPMLVLGPLEVRRQFLQSTHDLTGFAPAVCAHFHVPI